MTQNQKEKFKNHNKRRLTSSRKRKNFMNLGFLISLFSLMILGSSISYVLVKNDLSIKGFVINDLQKELNHLKNKNENLQLDLTSLESYSNLAIRVKELGMVKTEKVEYISPGELNVAMR